MAEKNCPSILSKGLIVSHLLIGCLLTGSLGNAASIGDTAVGTDHCDSQIYCQGNLLKTVQLAKLFNDSKTFVDHYQLNDPEITIANFNKLMSQTGSKPTKEQVRKYVTENFSQQDELTNWLPSDWQESPEFLKRVEDPNFREWIKQLNEIWKILSKKIGPSARQHPERHSLIPVENGFVVPGGRFQESYYWDSYWVVEGLLLSGMKNTTKGILENFLSMVERFGFIPNGLRVYYLMRSHPPLLIPMVERYLAHTGDMKFLADNLATLEKEFAYFQREKSVNVVKNGQTYKMARYIVNSVGPRPESYSEDYDLAQKIPISQDKKIFYEDLKAAAESGWDFSARWFVSADGGVGNMTEIHTRNIIPVDLNALLQRNARLLSEFNILVGTPAKVKYYKDIAAEFQRAIDNVLWSEAEGVWLDYDIKFERHRNIFLPTNLTPLYTKSFDPKKSQMHGDRAVAYLKKNKIGDFMGGIPASLMRTGEQWDMPYAWAPLQSFVVQGLRNTGTVSALKAAEEFAVRWLRSNYAAFNDYGQMFEKYDAEHPGKYGGGGEYVVQEGFGWSNGAIFEFLDTYPNATSMDYFDENNNCDNCIHQKK